MEIILTEFEHQSTKKPEHDDALSVGKSWGRQAQQGAPTDVQPGQDGLPPPPATWIGQNLATGL